MPRIRVCLLALACPCLGLTSAALAAQQQLGTIQGTVTDQTHGVLPGATGVPLAMFADEFMSMSTVTNDVIARTAPPTVTTASTS